MYMAPEILSHNNKYDGKAADIYNLGYILFMTIFRMYPNKCKMNGSNIYIDTMNLLWSDSEDDRANYWLIYETLIGYQISPPLKNVLEIMLAKNPTKRPKADEALQHPWFKSGPELS